MSSTVVESQSSTKKGLSTLSKKRFSDIKEAFQNRLQDEEVTKQLLNILCEIMQFDPDVSRYTPELGQKIKEYRHKLRDEKNISTYITNGGKKRYDALKLREQCNNYLCESKGYPQYNNYCIRCFVHMFPNEGVVKNYKTKESHVVEYVKSLFSQYCTSFDKIVSGGCSRYRPDILMDCLTHSIIIEVDENQHDSYDCTCENKRLMTLFHDLGSRPLVMIRFNPDDYVNAQGSSMPSCFSYTNRHSLPQINKKSNWTERLDTLANRVRYHIDNVPEQEVTLEHLFYDGFH